MFRRMLWLVFICPVLFSSQCFAIGQEQYVDFNPGKDGFCIAQKDNVAGIYIDSNDYPGVIRAGNDLQADINRVTGQMAKITNEETVFGKNMIIIGTIGKSPIIDRLIKDGKIDVKQIAGKWESFLIQVAPKPLAGVENALVIAGSDKRGTIYGIYDLSEQIGVSPWYWWADVPVQHKDALFVKAGKYVQGPPAVKYRGIFLNDEGWALSPWVKEKYGNYNSKFYTKVFELLLRLKANFLWPAMWDNAFNEDDPNNPRLADEYGIVMGNSHQEPMLRAQKEWDRRYQSTLGNWNYYTDANTLQNFWREGIRRNKNYESIISIGLRGADDTPMIPNGTVAESMALLGKIVGVQRKIITEEVNPDVTKVPQLWCPYKEVQEYYEKGLRVPDDVTMLWCDDNWGNLRRLPTVEERKRSGGAGVYYHFDFHGGPRSYEWLNTTQIIKVWEQMNLAYNYGATKIWIVNVGDLKPMEFPMEFFMTFAWDPQRWPKEKISEFTRLWAQREFGPQYADQIADIVSKYTKYNARRKPELLDPGTFSIINYREADTVVADFNAITAKAEQIYQNLPDSAKDAFFQLVLYPTKACAQVTELYVTAGKNKLYAEQKRASTNDLAVKTRALFEADAELSQYYNRKMANGKWNHMMDTSHIGYTSWNPPPKNNMPKVEEINVPAEPNMGVAVEGLRSAWPGSSDGPVLPGFSVFGEQRRYIDVFNRGQTPFEFSAKPSAGWIVLSSTKGTVEKETRLWVNIDYSKAPAGDANGSVKISGPGAKEVNIKINSFNFAEPNKDSLEGFAEADGYVSIEAEHYTKKIDAGEVRWEKIEDYGRTDSAMTIFPVTAQSVTLPKDSPRLEYKMFLFHSGNIEVETIVAPTLNFVPDRDLRYAVSFDDQPPQIISIVPKNYIVAYSNDDWQESVRNNARIVKSNHSLPDAGYHTLKVWMVDPAVVLEKIVVNTGGVRPSYFGPPESYRGTSAGSDTNVVENIADGSGAFATGNYRNLFVEAGHSQKEVTAKVNTAFQQLFHGDPCTQAVYFPAGKNVNGPLAYIWDIGSNDVRSEGMSYGMMITVQLDKKAEFDALWNWAKTYMHHDLPNHPAYGFFSWSVKTNGVPNDEMPSPDGEEYFVTSLYFAANRWGDGQGIYNYKAEADRLLNDMKNRAIITGPTVKGTMTAGGLFDAEHKMVRFTPDIVNIEHTDPSYHLPAFYELWARWGPEADRSFWAQAALTSREFFQRATNPITGLAPEYANFDGTPWASPWNSNSANFQFDSWRTAMNWSVDWAWWGRDARERQLSDRLQAFFESKGISTYGNQFTLDGKQFGSDHSAGLVAMNAVAGLAAANPRAKQFVEAIWNMPIPTGQWRYYDGMLYMLTTLHCSGEFRIWRPK